MIKGTKQKERLHTWYKHYYNLLGKLLEIKDDIKVIIKVIHYLRYTYRDTSFRFSYRLCYEGSGDKLGFQQWKIQSRIV